MPPIVFINPDICQKMNGSCKLSYSEQIFKIPQESDDYQEASAFAIQSIEEIIKNAIEKGENKIIINTNLKLGLPMENINKIAGPFVEINTNG